MPWLTMASIPFRYRLMRGGGFILALQEGRTLYAGATGDLAAAAHRDWRDISIS